MQYHQRSSRAVLGRTRHAARQTTIRCARTPVRGTTMKRHATRWGTWSLIITLSAFAAGCGGSSGVGAAPAASPTGTRTATARAATPTPPGTVTPTRTPALATSTPTQTQQTGACVTALVVVNHAITASTNETLGAPPAEWAATPENAAFDKAL